MRTRPFRSLFLVSLLVFAVRAPRLSGAEPLTGKWTLREGSGAEAGAAEVPLEALVDASRVGVEEDGKTVRITYPSGRQRAFVVDGEERELDDGDGPAAVVARRKDGKLALFSKWSRERALHETWERQGAALVVTGAVEGRRSFRYRRVYDPAPASTVIVRAAPAVASLPYATPKPAPTPAPGATPGPGAAVPAPGPTPAGSAACSIRPPKGAGRAELSRLARIGEEDAQARASAAVAPKKATSVISSSVEVEDGCLVWPFAVRTEGGGIFEVSIDAGDGKVIYAGLPRD